MSFSLIRVDDRMIHGQVVVGWAGFLHPNRIILCHNAIAASAWEKELYVSSFSDADVQICVFNTDELKAFVKSEAFRSEKVILLIENPRDALHLLEENIPIGELNIGGMHYGPGKTELISYIYLGDEDIRSLQQLENRGVVIQGQDTPSGKKVNVMQLIRDRRGDAII